MALKKGNSEKTISENIAELIRADYDPKQAAAIAYATARKTGGDSARTYDLNGWPEIKSNPISKTGVFPYLGRQIHDSLDPDKVYQVYRPADELSSSACIDSFRLLPITDEHAMLGTTDGYIPPEQHGIHGVIGQDVHFDGNYLRANLKILSNKLRKAIDSGKKDLSIGYHCEYDLSPGVFDGKKYDAIQRKIRGNHVALVHEGRAGKDVAVLDHFTFTADGAIEMPKKEAEDSTSVSLETLNGMMKEMMDGHKKMSDRMDKYDEMLAKMNPPSMPNPNDHNDNTVMAKGADEKKLKEDEKEEDEKKKKDGMDAQIAGLKEELEALKNRDVTSIVFAQIAKRDDLVKKLVPHIGVFDHADKSITDVAKYGVKKLNLTCDNGMEEATLSGYLAAVKTAVPVHAADSKDTVKTTNTVFSYIQGGK